MNIMQALTTNNHPNMQPEIIYGKRKIWFDVNENKWAKDLHNDFQGFAENEQDAVKWLMTGKG